MGKQQPFRREAEADQTFSINRGGELAFGRTDGDNRACLCSAKHGQGKGSGRRPIPGNGVYFMQAARSAGPCGQDAPSLSPVAKARKSCCFIESHMFLLCSVFAFCKRPMQESVMGPAPHKFLNLQSAPHSPSGGILVGTGKAQSRMPTAPSSSG